MGTLGGFLQSLSRVTVNSTYAYTPLPVVGSYSFNHNQLFVDQLMFRAFLRIGQSIQSRDEFLKNHTHSLGEFSAPELEVLSQTKSIYLEVFAGAALNIESATLFYLLIVGLFFAIVLRTTRRRQNLMASSVAVNNFVDLSCLSCSLDERQLSH